MQLRDRNGLSLAAKVLVIGAVVLGGLTMAAAAREPRQHPGEPPGGQADTTAALSTRAAVQELPSSAQDAAPEHPMTIDQEGATAASAKDVVAPADGSIGGGAARRFRIPLSGWTVTDRYGAARGGGLIHGGIDLALSGHAPVAASCAGTVASTSYNGTYGYHVIVDCGDGWSTLYGHLSEVKCAPGQAVMQETVIGISGSTGYSTGEHLHFEVRWKGIPVNPESYLDFHIAPGTPLSSGPITFGKPAARATSEAPDTPTPAPPPDTPTPIPTPTATKVPPTATPTATPTITPTPTKRPQSRTATAPPAARSD